MRRKIVRKLSFDENLIKNEVILLKNNLNSPQGQKFHIFHFFLLPLTIKLPLNVLPSNFYFKNVCVCIKIRFLRIKMRDEKMFNEKPTR